MTANSVPIETEPTYAAMRSRKLRLLIPLIVAFAFLMEQLDSTIVTTAIPDIARTLQVAPLSLNLAITSYVLSLAVFMPVSGWIADRYGARRVFAAALVIFTVASALCGLSNSLPELVMTRVFQGFGGAMMTPVGRLVLIRAFPRNQLVTAMTYMTIPAVIGPTIGPILGGFLTTYASWRWVFYVNVPVGIVGVFLALRFVEDVRLEAPPKFDVTGFLLCGGGLGLLQFGLENVGHAIVPRPLAIGLTALGIALLCAYVPHARRRTDAALDLSLFKIRSFRVSTMAGGLSRMGVNAVPFMLPLMFQIGFGLSPVQSGSLTFVASIGGLAVRPISGKLMRQFGYRGLLSVNGVICAAMTASFALVQPSTPHWIVFLMVLLFGVLRSTQFMTTNTLTYADMPAAKLSRSTSLGGVIQQLTVSFGVSTAAALLGVIAGPGRLPDVADFHLAFVLVALITLVSAPGFLQLKAEDGAAASGHKQKAA
ncbi:DHA2 family efflux MFS transporter permease subunit [Acidisphaera sp. L21]|uniref:DHA2 family efflux MFS transporter permease subunit n=1 Tax=Acidisphaera sp. L21 TaxID=1641851 RepID=UPI00131A98F3|nr:DHA2 family efflux MFS transporter permease subunit [Acidisphaera sp. L21]